MARRVGQGEARATHAFSSVRYVGAFTEAQALPPGPPAFAMLGRSNVGKSSLLNALCGARGLARTSKTPGRTQLIHLYEASHGRAGALRLCDLPGYGHAAAPGAVRDTFGPMIEGLLRRGGLAAAVLLWDARRDPDEDTLGFLAWLAEAALPVRVVVTKIDKIPRNQQHGRLVRLGQAMELAEPPLGTSATAGEGVDALRRWLLAKAAEARGGR
jgi:GTP-binding protein